jgi:hypothetical protein
MRSDPPSLHQPFELQQSRAPLGIQKFLDHNADGGKFRRRA